MDRKKEREGRKEGRLVGGLVDTETRAKEGRIRRDEKVRLVGRNGKAAGRERRRRARGGWGKRAGWWRAYFMATLAHLPC